MPTSSGLTSNPSALDQRVLSSDEQRIFYPERSNSVWMVRSGRVDLFFQKMVDSDYGARHHIASFLSGQVIFGIDLQQHGGLSLVAVMHPETTLDRVSRAVFRRRNTLSHACSPCALAEGWVHALAKACTPAPPPREAVTILAGAKVEAADVALAVTPEEMICWVRPLTGEARLFGWLPVAGQSLIPLSRSGQAWIALAPASSVEAVAAYAIDAIDPEWSWLDSFHSAVLACLLKRLDAEEAKWMQSLLEQQAADTLLAHRALKSLTAPLFPGRKHVEDGMQRDPLLLACKVLERDMGIEFKAAPSAKENTSFRYGVEAVAHASSLRQRQVSLRGDWWKQDCGPLLAMRKEDQCPIALVFRTSGYYECFDPVQSTFQRVDAAVAASLNTAAYLFYRRFPLRALRGSELAGLIFGASGRDLLRVLMMGIAGGILSLAFPITLGIIFDSVIPGAERGNLLGLSGLLAVAAVASATFALVRSLATLRVEARIDAVAQAAVWDRLLRLPAPFFRLFSSGDLAVRSLAINYIRMILTNSTLAAILSGVFSLFNLVLLFFYSTELAWLALGMTVAFFVFATLSALAQLRYTRNIARIRGRISATLLEFMNGISKLRTYGAEHRAFSVWAQLFSQQKKLHMRTRTLALWLSVLRSVYPLTAIGILFLVASPAQTGHARSALSTGSFLAFFAAFVQFLSSSVQFASVLPSLIMVVPVFERLLPILQTAPEVEEGRSSPGELRGSIEVSHVNFRYDNTSSPILRDVSFQVRPGEFVAFTGPSGSGKSTLLRLLLGFEKPEGGSISFDDQDILGIDVQALRRQVGVVLQSGRLVSGTILDNIIGSLPLSHDEAWEAARMAGLDKDVKSMPMGMHTFVNDGGVGLSGGQRQRLMIARAIVNKPRILFFDEATSALDNHTQAVVSRSLEALQATRVVIAHRLSTIQQADRIYVFDKGAIVQTGTYAELNQAPGLFQTLVQRQIV